CAHQPLVSTPPTTRKHSNILVCLSLLLVSPTKAPKLENSREQMTHGKEHGQNNGNNNNNNKSSQSRKTLASKSQLDSALSPKLDKLRRAKPRHRKPLFPYSN